MASGGKVENFLIPGRFLEAALVSRPECASRIASEPGWEVAAASSPPTLTANEHRLMIALFMIHADKSYSEDTFAEGITCTARELCKAAQFTDDANVEIGGKSVSSIYDTLLNLSKQTFTITFRKPVSTENGVERSNYVIIPNCPLIQIVKTVENVTDAEFRRIVLQKQEKIHIRILYDFFSARYFKKFDFYFYQNFKKAFPGRHPGKFHWPFYFWLLRDNNTPQSQINSNKLLEQLKMTGSANHRATLRRRLTDIYEDFKKLGYLLDYKVDVPGKRGRRKDILYPNPEKLFRKTQGVLS